MKINKRERGQALLEYVATFPVAIAILLVASGLSAFLNDSYQKTADGFVTCSWDSEEDSNSEEDEGPTTAQLGCHTVTLVSSVYDEDSDTTTIVYRVTSACDPSISHWTLGLPPGIASKVIRASELYEIGLDPTTSNYGIKFDKGYGDGGNNNSNKNNNKGPKNTSLADEIFLVSGTHYATTETRDVLLTLGGHFQWSTTTVTLKAGTNVYSDSISAPVAEEEEDQEDNSESDCEE